MSMAAGSVATTVIVGPDGHGAVRHAATIAELTDSAVVRLEPSRPISWPPSPVHHLHYTDRLFGETTEQAAHCFDELVDSVPGPIVVTLHDVPASDSSVLSARRKASYRGVASRAAGVIVASGHERARAEQCGITTDVTVIRLPIQPMPRTVGSFVTSGQTVGVVGFIYPGKGHTDVLAALADVSPDVSMWALGAVSDGHDDLLATLERQAVRTRRRLIVSGLLDEPTMDAALRTIDVPVVPARSPSASASLATWIGAGRRPVAALNSYTAEIAAASEDLITLYHPDEPGALAAAVRSGLQRRERTWHHGVVPECFSPRAVAQQHRQLYLRVAIRA